MTDLNRVDVVMPVYNRERFVADAIESVIGQTFTTWRLYAIDDGSTDDSAAVVSRYLSDPRVTLIRQSNSGQATARNKGVAAGCAPFVCFLDSDNLWEPCKLQEQLAVMDSPDAPDVLYGEVATIDEDGKSLPPMVMKRYSGKVIEQLLRDNFVNFNTSMVRRQRLESVGGFDPAVRRADDYDLWLRLSPSCRFQHVPRTWARYRVMRDQISSDKRGRFESNLRIITRFMDANPEIVTPEMRRDALQHFHLRRARYLSGTGERREAFADLWAAFLQRPLSLKLARGSFRVMLDALR